MFTISLFQENFAINLPLPDKWYADCSQGLEFYDFRITSLFILLYDHLRLQSHSKVKLDANYCKVAVRYKSLKNTNYINDPTSPLHFDNKFFQTLQKLINKKK